MAEDTDHSGISFEPACPVHRSKSRCLGMTSAGSSLSSGAFATADAGFEYLATAEHYRYLARGIVDALRRACLVVVTGDPPASPPMLAVALREAATPRAVLELSCGPGLDCEKPFGGGWMRADPPAPVAAGEEPGRSVSPSPIFVFAAADRLSDDQIEKFREEGTAVPPGPHGFEAGGLLAGSPAPPHETSRSDRQKVDPHPRRQKSERVIPSGRAPPQPRRVPAGLHASNRHRTASRNRGRGRRRARALPAASRPPSEPRQASEGSLAGRQSRQPGKRGVEHPRCP